MLMRQTCMNHLIIWSNNIWRRMKNILSLDNPLHWMLMLMNLHVKNNGCFHYNALCNPGNYYGWTENKLCFKITISLTVKGLKTTSSNNNSEVCIHFFALKFCLWNLTVTRASSTENPQKRKYNLLQGYVLQDYCTL